MILAVLGISVIALTGCGGRTTVSVDSQPQGADVYLIPLFDWQQRGEEDMLDQSDALEAYRVRRGPTPVTTPAKTYTYILVGCIGSDCEWYEVRPKGGIDNSYLIRFPQQGARP
jgi:hypothetical protein